MNARDYYWNTYAEIRGAERYYYYYRCWSRRWDLAISIVLTVASLSCVATWAIWQQLPWLWGVIISVSQITSAVRHFLPFSARITSTGLMLPELRELLDDLDASWIDIESGVVDNSGVRELIAEYSKRMTEIERKYECGADYPVNRFCQKRADRDKAIYFENRYRVCHEKLEVT